MWQSWNEKKDGKNVADGEKCQQFDSGHVDSGFLSGTNIVSEELEFDGVTSQGNVASEPSVVHESMRADSGVDLGISEDLSNLTLKSVTLNPLSGKVQFEPTELTPVTTQLTQQRRRDTSTSNINLHIQKQQIHNLHEYYMQDDDGDT